MSTSPLTTADFSQMSCMHPGCQRRDCELILHSACHPQAPTWASYLSGVITVRCSKCKKQVCQVAVAAADGQGTQIGDGNIQHNTFLEGKDT